MTETTSRIPIHSWKNSILKTPSTSKTSVHFKPAITFLHYMTKSMWVFFFLFLVQKNTKRHNRWEAYTDLKCSNLQNTKSFEVSTVGLLRVQILKDVAWYDYVSGFWHLRITWCLPLQGLGGSCELSSIKKYLYSSHNLSSWNGWEQLSPIIALHPFFNEM